MKKTILAAMIALVCGVAQTEAQTVKQAVKQAERDRPPVSERDRLFIRDAAQGGLTEVSISKLAIARNCSPSVMSLAKMMVKDHDMANSELSAAAKRKHVGFPTSLDEKHQKAYNDLEAKTGMDFEKAYLSMLESDHKMTIDMFTNYSAQGDEMELKKWASAKVPTLQHHLEMTQKTQKDLK